MPKIIKKKEEEVQEQVVPAGRIDDIQCDGEVVPISSLKEDPNNARLHPERNLESIKDSLNLYGQREPLVVRQQNLVIAAGNGRIRAMRELGWTKCAVTMRPMTDLEFTGFALADNRTAELAMWDAQMVARLDALLQSGGVPNVGWSMEELEALRAQDVPTYTDPEEVPDPPKVAVSQLGDLWLLGNHRLICGDAEDPEVVARLLGKAKPFLMVTDPPYGVEYDPTWRDAYGPSRAFEKLTGNAWDRSQAPRARGKVENDTRVDWSGAYKLFPGDVVYCWHAGRFASAVQASLESSGFEIRVQIIWAKQHFVFGRGHYHWKHEPCWYAVRKGKQASYAGDRTQTTVWEIQNQNPMGGKRDEALLSHGTQKPVECMARPIRHHGGPKEDVYDPFVGSGTTIIACQQLGRKCFAVELDPTYVDVCLTRFANFSGVDPVREGDGVTWSELQARAKE